MSFSSLRLLVSTHLASVAFFCSLAFLCPCIASAATLALVPASGNYPVGTIFSISVDVQSDGTALNAVSGVVTFPADVLEVVSLSKGGSIISLWVQEPAFSNVVGSVQFEGVVPNPGYSGRTGKVLTVLFRVKKEGASTISFAGASVLANDGEGTEVLTAKIPAKIILVPSAETVAPVSVPADPDVPREQHTVTENSAKDTKRLPLQILSDTHPANSWSSLSTGKFSFMFPKEANALRVSLTATPSSSPTVLYAPATTSLEIKNLKEGISYVHAQYRTSEGWSDVVHYVVRVDTVPPTPFTITEVSPGSFSFNATDTQSGIARYDVALDSGEPVAFSDDGGHRYTAPPLSLGTHILNVYAFDAAGNSTMQTISYESPVSSENTLGNLGTKTSIASILVMTVTVPLVVLVLVLAALLYAVWKAARDVRNKVSAEAHEAKKIIHRAFSLLQSDIADDIEMLEKAKTKRTLTKEEVKILERLKENLDEAENVITQEIADIETLTR